MNINCLGCLPCPLSPDGQGYAATRPQAKNLTHAISMDFQPQKIYSGKTESCASSRFALEANFALGRLFSVTEFTADCDTEKVLLCFLSGGQGYS